MEILVFAIAAFICIGGLGAAYLVYKAVIDRLDKIEADKVVIISQINALTSKNSEREAVEAAIGQVFEDMQHQGGDFEELYPVDDEDLN